MNRMSQRHVRDGLDLQELHHSPWRLDSGKVTLTDSFDARNPIRIGGFTIKDFHGKHRVLTVPEIFQYSSNIGTAKMADLVGIDGHKEFLTRLGSAEQDADRTAGSRRPRRSRAPGRRSTRSPSRSATASRPRRCRPQWPVRR